MSKILLTKNRFVSLRVPIRLECLITQIHICSVDRSGRYLKTSPQEKIMFIGVSIAIGLLGPLSFMGS